ncbi:MAG: ABC transporter permease subunit [Streptosporangiales bacterium]|nr:ABC transporter permease subunit [Streptosporangiales bacterium]
MNEEPLIRWDWIGRNIPDIAGYLGENMLLALVPVVLGLIMALPLGLISVRWRRLFPPVLTTTSILYAIPSLALFMLFINITGLTYWTVMIPLSLFSLSVLVPNVVDGLNSVPMPVRQAAEAMGFGGLRRLLQVELPIAVPVIIAGLRVATVSNISMVSVGAIMGMGGLGYYFTDGLQRDFATPIFVGIVLIVALAFLADGVLLIAQRVLTPWSRSREGAA